VEEIDERDGVCPSTEGCGVQGNGTEGDGYPHAALCPHWLEEGLISRVEPFLPLAMFQSQRMKDIEMAEKFVSLLLICCELSVLCSSSREGVR
jgi:hypothetical protein